jgi:hypothetical protein
MVPVACVQVAGSVTLTLGSFGVEGRALIVTIVAAEIHPAAFFTETL